MFMQHAGEGLFGPRFFRTSQCWRGHESDSPKHKYLRVVGGSVGLGNGKLCFAVTSGSLPAAFAMLLYFLVDMLNQTYVVNTCPIGSHIYLTGQEHASCAFGGGEWGWSIVCVCSIDTSRRSMHLLVRWARSLAKRPRGQFGGQANKNKRLASSLLWLLGARGFAYQGPWLGGFPLWLIGKNWI